MYNRGKNINSYKGQKYPIIYTPSKIIYTNKLELAPGFKIKKAIVFSISPDLAFKMDYYGKYGAGPNTFFIPFKTNSEGKNLEKFLNSNDYKTLALSTKTNRQFLKIALLEHLKLTKILSQNYNSKKTRKFYKKLQRNNKTRKL